MTASGPAKGQLAKPSYTVAELESHLAPDNTRSLLLLAGLYQVTYQLIKGMAVSKLRSFFSEDWLDWQDPKQSPEYLQEASVVTDTN